MNEGDNEDKDEEFGKDLDGNDNGDLYKKMTHKTNKMFVWI